LVFIFCFSLIFVSEVILRLFNIFVKQNGSFNIIFAIFDGIHIVFLVILLFKTLFFFEKYYFAVLAPVMQILYNTEYKKFLI